MFLGEYEHSLDEKFRVVLPSAMRRNLDEQEIARGFVVVPSDTNECLELYPWELFERRIQDLERTHDPHRNTAAREFLRDYAGRAVRAQCDGQGRILLPESSRRAVGIEREVQFVGLVRFLEIWAKTRWQARQDSKGH